MCDAVTAVLSRNDRNENANCVACSCCSKQGAREDELLRNTAAAAPPSVGQGRELSSECKGLPLFFRFQRFHPTYFYYVCMHTQLQTCMSRLYLSGCPPAGCRRKLCRRNTKRAAVLMSIRIAVLISQRVVKLESARTNSDAAIRPSLQRDAAKVTHTRT